MQRGTCRQLLEQQPIATETTGRADNATLHRLQAVISDESVTIHCLHCTCTAEAACFLLPPPLPRIPPSHLCRPGLAPSVIGRALPTEQRLNDDPRKSEIRPRKSFAMTPCRATLLPRYDNSGRSWIASNPALIECRAAKATRVPACFATTAGAVTFRSCWVLCMGTFDERADSRPAMASLRLRPGYVLGLCMIAAVVVIWVAATVLVQVRTCGSLCGAP